MLVLAVVVLISLINVSDGFIYKDWFPEDLEDCLITQCRGKSAKELSPFSILFYCLNVHEGNQDIDKPMLGPITDDDENYYKMLGRMMNGMILDKRKKRSYFYHKPRREIRTLPTKDRQAFFKVMQDLKDDGKYDAIAKLHQQRAIPSGHFGMGFPAWHRCYLLLLQLAVWEKNVEVTIPFADLRLESNMPSGQNDKDSLLFSDKYYGMADGNVRTGFCKNWPTTAGVTLQRDFGKAGKFIKHEEIHDCLQKNISTSVLYIESGRCNIEQLHNQCHLRVGGLMGDLLHAPADPFFHALHCWMDYVWDMILKKQYYHGIDPWVTSDNQFHKKNATVEMLAQHLRSPLKIGHMYSRYFQTLVRYDHSHYDIKTCAQYEDILVDHKRKCCYAKQKSKDEKNKERMLKFMRSGGKRHKVQWKFGDKKPLRKIQRRKRSTWKTRGKKVSQYSTLTDIGLHNNFLLNGVVSERKWCYLPIRIVYERNPYLHFKTDTAKYQRVMEERAEHKREEKLGRDDEDLFSAHRYPKLWKKLKPGHPDSMTKPKIQAFGAYRLMFQSNGFSYDGKYTSLVNVDEHQLLAETVGYVAVKRPDHGETVQALITAFDPTGSVCEARCHVHGSSPPKYERCSGVININDKKPKMYGNTLGDAYLLRYNFQGDNLPISHDGNIFLMFYCNYKNKFPWEMTYRKK